MKWLGHMREKEEARAPPRVVVGATERREPWFCELRKTGEEKWVWWGACVNNFIVDILTLRQLAESRVQGAVWLGGINLGILSLDMVFKAMGLGVPPVGTRL